MHIAERTAASIVAEISGIIGQRINMMDERGVIIASSDPARVGTMHDAARRIVRDGLPELVVHSDTEYEGSRRGVNLAVELNGKTVGVIGVTGPYEEVSKYGQIIKKITEILLKEEYNKEQRERDDRAKMRFLGEWLYGDPRNINREFHEYGISLGVDISRPRRLFSVAVQPEDGGDSRLAQKSIDGAYRVIKTFVLNEPDSFILASADSLMCGVGMRGDDDMLVLAGTVKTESEIRYPVTVAVGVDSAGTRVWEARVKAEKAMRTCLRSAKKEPRLYADITMEIFSAELPDSVKQDYIGHVFRNYLPSEIPALIILLDTFYECEGSVSLASEKMNMHKNTLQYKLKKISERTGYDPRSIKYSSLFYNAIHFYRDISGSCHAPSSGWNPGQ